MSKHAKPTRAKASAINENVHFMRRFGNVTSVLCSAFSLIFTLTFTVQVIENSD
jgi:hypothetical protein